MRGAAALGSQDAQSPFVSSPAGVPLGFDAGRAADEPNFNAGVMLMDLTQWRASGVTDATLRYLTDGSHHFGQDQEALNVVLAGRIGRMDPRWNQQTEIFWPEYNALQPYARATVEKICAELWIIHFANGPKPWAYECTHLWREEWFKYIDQTAFGPWRPAGPTRVQRTVKVGLRLGRKWGRRVGLLVPVGFEKD